MDEYKRRNLPLGYYNQLPTFAQSPISARTTQSYIIVGPRIRGKFNSARAKELGVPNGPLCGRLTKGESVTFEVKVKVKKTVKDVNGTEKIIEVQEVEQRTVDPDEVMGKSEAPGVCPSRSGHLYIHSSIHFYLICGILQAILVLDVPTTSHIPSLLSTFTNSDYYRHFRSKGLTDSGDFSDVGIIYHVLGEGVLEDRRYGEFLQGFNDNVHVSTSPIISFASDTQFLVCSISYHPLSTSQIPYHSQMRHTTPFDSTNWIKKCFHYYTAVCAHRSHFKVNHFYVIFNQQVIVDDVSLLRCHGPPCWIEGVSNDSWYLDQDETTFPAQSTATINSLCNGKCKPSNQSYNRLGCHCWHRENQG